MHHSTITVYTDGSCKGNPGPGGWAALLFSSHDKKTFQILKGHELSTTNNRMEMMAIIEALTFIREHHLQGARVQIFSDSNLIVQTINQGWKRKANLDLWKKIDALHEELFVEYTWVKGHASNKWNIECDKIAQREASKAMKLARSIPKTLLKKNFSEESYKNRTTEPPSKQQKLF